MAYAQEAYKMWVSTAWNGYGDGLNPKQTTLDGWVKFVKENKIGNTTGNSCNTAYTITTYDATAQTGTIAFADMSKYKDCDEVWKNMSSAKYTETQKFAFKKVNGETVMTYQSPLIYAKTIQVIALLLPTGCSELTTARYLMGNTGLQILNT